jgi:undecaprenyl-diphosphatase
MRCDSGKVLHGASACFVLLASVDSRKTTLPCGTIATLDMHGGACGLTAIQAAILGFIQGLTEFLPVSSSGHLVLTQQLLGISVGNLGFDVVVHLGTLVAVFAALWDDVSILLQGLSLKSSRQARTGRRLILMLIIGTLPAAVIGLIFRDQIEALFASVYTTGIMLIATGTLLFFAEKARTGQRKMAEIRPNDALFVGCGQALAILPGLSRSGTTISASLIRGIARDDAARFSFLLSIPAILGAAVLELPDALADSATLPMSTLLIGFVIAAITGYASITLLVRFVRRGKLTVFSYYTWAAGVLTLLITYLGG